MGFESRRQFLLSEGKLETLYRALESYSNLDLKPDAKLILSKPENREILVEDVYDDFFLLELLDSEIDFLITVYSTYVENGKERASLLLRNSVQRGVVERDEN